MNRKYIINYTDRQRAFRQEMMAYLRKTIDD